MLVGSRTDSGDIIWFGESRPSSTSLRSGLGSGRRDRQAIRVRGRLDARCRWQPPASERLQGAAFRRLSAKTTALIKQWTRIVAATRAKLSTVCRAGDSESSRSEFEAKSLRAGAFSSSAAASGLSRPSEFQVTTSTVTRSESVMDS